MKVALYARVSTDDKGQEPETQLMPLREFVKARGWEVYKEYIDRESGGKGREGRPDFNNLFLDAHKHLFDVAVFWSLDRLSREGTAETINHLKLLDSYGVGYVSYTEQYLDTTGIFKEAIIGLLAALAKQQRQRISDNAIAGVARAEAWGKIIGKHPKDCGCGSNGHNGMRKPIRDAHNKVIGWDPPLSRNRRRAAKTPMEKPTPPVYKESPSAKPGVLAGRQEGP